MVLQIGQWERPASWEAIRREKWTLPHSVAQSIRWGPEDSSLPASIPVFITVLHSQRCCCHCWHCHFLGQDVHLRVLRVHLCYACCMTRLAESSDWKPCHPVLRYSGKASCKESHVSIHPMSPRGSGNKNIGAFSFLLRDLKILDLVLELIKASTRCLPIFKVNWNISSQFRMHTLEYGFMHTS